MQEELHRRLDGVELMVHMAGKMAAHIPTAKQQHGSF